MQNLPFLISVIYIIVTTVIAFTQIKGNKDTKSFAVASGGLTFPAVVAMLFSEMVAGSGTIGNATTGYTTGLSSVWANWGMCLGCILFVCTVSKFYKAMGTRFGVISVPEAYEKFFDFRCRMVLLVIIVLVYGILFSTQAKAAAAIIAPMIGCDVTLMTIIVACIFVIVTVIGGMKGVASMNLLHSIIMYLGVFIILGLALNKVGGINVLTATLPETYFDLGQPSWLTTIASAVGTAFSYLAAATTVNAVFTSKSTKVASIGCIVAGVLIVIFALGPSLIGMCGKILLPEGDPKSIIYLVAAEFGPLASGIISMAILAAIFSTGPSLLLVVCTTITRDLYVGVIKKDATDKQQLSFTRIMAVVVGLGASMLGLLAGSILSTMLGAFQIRSVVGLVLVIAIFWKRVNATGAFWSMLTGGVVAAIWFFTGEPFGISAFWPAAVVTVVILVIVTLIGGKEPESESHKIYTEAVAYTAEHEKQAV